MSYLSTNITIPRIQINLMVCCVQWEDLLKLSMLCVQLNVPLGTLCHPQTIPPGGMLCTISVVKCTYKVLSL